MTPILMLLLCLMMTACAVKRTTASAEQISSATSRHEALAEQVTESAAEKAATQMQEADQSTTTLLYEQMIPASKVGVSLPTQSLLDLPDGAGYYARSDDGRASLNITRQGDKIIAESRCDSIARRCVYLESEVFRQRSRADSLSSLYTSQQTAYHEADSTSAQHITAVSQTLEKPPSGRWFRWFTIGVLAGVMATTLLYKTDIIKWVIAAFKRLFL